MMKYMFDQNVPCKIYDQRLVAFTYYELFTFLRFLKTQKDWHKLKRKKKKKKKKRKNVFR